MGKETERKEWMRECIQTHYICTDDRAERFDEFASLLFLPYTPDRTKDTFLPSFFLASYTYVYIKVLGREESQFIHKINRQKKSCLPHAKHTCGDINLHHRERARAGSIYTEARKKRAGHTQVVISVT